MIRSAAATLETADVCLSGEESLLQSGIPARLDQKCISGSALPQSAGSASLSPLIDETHTPQQMLKARIGPECLQPRVQVHVHEKASMLLKGLVQPLHSPVGVVKSGV